MSDAEGPKRVGEDQLATWEEDGYLVFDSFADAETLERLRAAYDDVLEGNVHADGDRQLGGVTRQVMRPSESHPTFADNRVLERALLVGAQLLGTDEVDKAFDMLIFKPAGHPHPTPWHQDAAYDAMPYAPAGTKMRLDSVQFWVPLDDVDDENGCMQFIAGFHRQPLLEHVVAAGDAGDEGRLLALRAPKAQLPLSDAVVAEIPAGGATVHSYGTPHFTGPNVSRHRQRRSYIINVARRDRP